MKKTVKMLICLAAAVMIFVMSAIPALADEGEDGMLIATNESESAESAEAKVTSTKAISAGVAIAVVAAVGALSMALSISKSAEAIARQPEAAGQVRTSLMLGLVFIETAIIYALIMEESTYAAQYRFSAGFAASF